MWYKMYFIYIFQRILTNKISSRTRAISQTKTQQWSTCVCALCPAHTGLCGTVQTGCRWAWPPPLRSQGWDLRCPCPATVRATWHTQKHDSSSASLVRSPGEQVRELSDRREVSPLFKGQNDEVSVQTEDPKGQEALVQSPTEGSQLWQRFPSWHV